MKKPVSIYYSRRGRLIVSADAKHFAALYGCVLMADGNFLHSRTREEDYLIAQFKSFVDGFRQEFKS